MGDDLAFRAEERTDTSRGASPRGARRLLHNVTVSLAMRAACVVLLAAALACSTSDPDDARSIGVVHPGLAGTPVILAPDTVNAHQSFATVVHSFGSSSCTTPAGVDLDLDASSATITPYDVVAEGRGTVCTADYAPRPHPVTLTFTSPGPALIVARGYSVGGTVSGKTLVTIDTHVWVLP
jgi:hypothetical protein